jgi:beta-mannosidase
MSQITDPEPIRLKSSGTWRLKKLVLLFLLAHFMYCQKPKESEMVYPLNGTWQFRQPDSDQWLTATVPGCVHTDLMAHGQIPDPFFGNNEKDVQWVEKINWEYRTAFELHPDIADHDHIELVFEGLDTYAAVFLNDSLLLQTDNMFREWRVDCKSLLKTGENFLVIQFTSPVFMDSLKASALPYRLPDNRAFTRKAPFQYGWDWAPRLVTCGVWKPVYITAHNSFKTRDLFIRQNLLTEKKATFSLLLEYEATDSGTMKIVVTDDKSGSILKKSKLSFAKGVHTQETVFEIADPKLWWTNGLGDPHLYQLGIEVSTIKTKEIFREKVGIRTIELVQRPDSSGSSFFFELNGVPVFMKGANYVPMDHFPSRVPTEKYISIIDAAVSANMNMLRVWGGGIYENDIFYDLCDQNGILVWQDFMFACNMYPGDDDFIENIRQEATQQVKRLRKHPSLAVWCGNNEVDEGWHNWGWQKTLGYSHNDSTELWNNYLKIFEELFPEIVSDLSSHTPYIPTSPKTGWGHKEAMNAGSMHYWGVWWGDEPFEMYESRIGRFMSEYGFQGFPDIQTINSVLPEGEKHLKSNAFLNHQKHPRGMELIHIYMDREYPVPQNFEHYAYVSQLVQAYGIKKAIDAHRRAMPWCMGTLFWQLNDCWPVISWSAIDYLQNQKALYYFAQEAYSEVIISLEEKNNLVAVYLVSDNLSPIHASLELEIIDFYGNQKWAETTGVKIKPTSSGIYQSFIPQGFSKNDHLLSARLTSGDSLLASSVHYFVRAKALTLPSYKILKEINVTGKGFSVILTSDALVKNLFLSATANCSFENNYFDLMPGVAKSIDVVSTASLEEFESKLKMLSLKEINFISK